MALSRAVHAQLEEIATLKPGEIHAWGMVRIGHDDALRLIEGEEIYCVIEALVQRGMSPSVIRALLTSSGVETVQFVKESHEQTADQD